MRSATFTRDDGSQALVTQYDDGTMTLAERPAPHLFPVCTWGPPIEGEVSDPYDYRMDEARFRALLEEVR